MRFEEIITFISSNDIVKYIFIGVAIFFAFKIACYLLKAILAGLKALLKLAWKKYQEYKKERLKWRYARMSVDNPLLKRITSNRFIICMGGLGKGKSITMNLIAHYLFELREHNLAKSKRFNKIMRPEVVAETKALEQANLLPIYSNLDFIQDKAKAQELLPYLCLQKRAIQGAVFCIDEVSSLFPKELYYEAQGNPLIAEMKELFKKNRHYTNGWVLGTEQDGADIFVGFRKNGYALIHCLGTIAKISRFGKVLRATLNFFNAVLPAIFTSNWKRLFAQELFTKGKILVLLKMLLPSYLLLPIEYYTQKIAINKVVKKHFMRYTTRFDFDGAEYYIRYTNKDIFQYDTRAYKGEYAALFNADGTRRLIND